MSFSFYTRTGIAEALKETMADRQKSRGETWFCYHQAKQQKMWGNNEEMTEQMKIWRQQQKNGKLMMEEENNQTVKIQGREWYILVIQPTNDNDCSIDPMGFGYDDGAFMVSGFIYHFTRKENRDAIYKYVMKK